MSNYINLTKRIPADKVEKVCDQIVNNVSLNDNGCWVWQGARFGAGYGRITINGRQFYAHRVSSELFHDHYDPALLVCHECPGEHDKACINPWHLKQGDQAYNMSHPVTREQCRRSAAAARRKA